VAIHPGPPKARNRKDTTAAWRPRRQREISDESKRFAYVLSQGGQVERRPNALLGRLVHTRHRHRFAKPHSSLSPVACGFWSPQPTQTWLLVGLKPPIVALRLETAVHFSLLSGFVTSVGEGSSVPVRFHAHYYPPLTWRVSAPWLVFRQQIAIYSRMHVPPSV